MILGIFLCFFPLIAFTLFFILYYKLSTLHSLFAILLGLLAVLPISLIQYIVPDFSSLAVANPVLYSLLKSLILYSFVEEVIKTAFVFLLPHKNYEVRNFLFLGFILSLSVACFESSVYFFEHLQNAKKIGADLMYFQICLRIFSALLIHFTCTGLSSLFVFECRKKQFHFILLLLPILIHGSYDFFAGFQNNFRFFSFAVLLYSLIECRIKYSNIVQNS